MIKNEKELPHSKDSEMMVLGCMLTNPSNLIVTAAMLEEQDFYFDEHRILFKNLKKNWTHGKQHDYVLSN